MDTTADIRTATQPLTLDLSRLHGYRVREVCFVLGRLRIRFESPTGSVEQPLLECLVMPTMMREHAIISSEDERWAGVLRSLIGQDVTETYEEHGIGLRLELTHGSLRIHPRPAQRDGTPVARLGEFGDGAQREWLSGVDCFADLHREVR
ncbi:hypothetical protein Bra3105_14115 [Brachybacterium halotolerans subsp. kimchii]|uniref:hypothetical protein n=1 Tax=Brachybacterium halotolerans TaxID=2795215 RepID=UPI001E3C85B9|nr:hypothetical protein [Brachybacterium halotolerans]UEJ81973.1 hypothetical protein Bra3105_14115 [Brachybacterium halotolerans subsp. kimchii]